MQIYPPDYHKKFSPMNEFEKWAVVEVLNLNFIPNNMETYILQEGTYAVFDYKGSSSNTSIFQYIFSEWIPNSPLCALTASPWPPKKTHAHG